MESEDYMEVYKDIAKRPENFVIMDNGAFEFGASIDLGKYLSIILEVRPDEIVLPDRMFRAKDTIKMSKEFMDLMGCPRDYSPSIRGVAQGRTIEEFLECADALIAMGVDTIAIPKDYDIWEGGREVLAATIAFRTAKRGTDIHLLGMSATYDPAFGWSKELKSSIRSIDSAKPGILSCDGIRLHDGTEDRYKSSRPENYFEVELDNKNRKMLFHNLMVVKGHCE